MRRVVYLWITEIKNDSRHHTGRERALTAIITQLVQLITKGGIMLNPSVKPPPRCRIAQRGRVSKSQLSPAIFSNPKTISYHQDAKLYHFRELTKKVSINNVQKRANGIRNHLKPPPSPQITLSLQAAIVPNNLNLIRYDKLCFVSESAKGF